MAEIFVNLQLTDFQRIIFLYDENFIYIIEVKFNMTKIRPDSLSTRKDI